MSVTVRGHRLSEAQVRAITPVMASLLRGELPLLRLEAACVEALAAAGTPLPDEPEERTT